MATLKLREWLLIPLVILYLGLWCGKVRVYTIVDAIIDYDITIIIEGTILSFLEDGKTQTADRHEVATVAVILSEDCGNCSKALPAMKGYLEAAREAGRKVTAIIIDTDSEDLVEKLGITIDDIISLPESYAPEVIPAVYFLSHDSMVLSIKHIRNFTYSDGFMKCATELQRLG